MSRLEDSDLIWKNDTVPYSKAYGDIYYSTHDAIAETDHVFLSGIDAPDCWLNQPRFVIGETGFGAGVNFLATWDLWRQNNKPGSRLFYISVEAAPLSTDELEKAHAPYPELADLSEQLRTAYPDRHPGYHQIQLDGGRVELLLLFGPVEQMLAGLSADIDAWYLDGFAPSRNPEMWSSEVFAGISARSRKGTRLATYSSARMVQDGLIEAGFDCEKVAGFAGKRESLKAIKASDPNGRRQAPWFQRAEPIPRSAQVAVIGAGISGACMAAELRRSGVDVTLIDRHHAPAGEASGNPRGLIQPRPGGGNPAYERLQTSAYLHAVRTYDELSTDHDVWVGERGVLSFARDAAFLSRHRHWLEAGGLPDGHGRTVSASEGCDVSGLDLGASAAWFPKAGTIDPVAICQALLSDIPTVYGTNVSQLQRHQSKWQLLDADGKCFIEADAVVLANGFAASRLCPECEVPLHAKRGQISYIEATEASQKLRVGLSYGGYATPALSGEEGTYHILGATYQQWPDPQSLEWRRLVDTDHQENLSHVGGRLPMLDAALSGPVLGGRATLRTTTADHLPVVGPAFNADAYQRDYHDLRHGKPPHTYPNATFTPGIYMLSALGSRGFALAPLLAKILTAEMLGTPMPVDKAVHNLVHPARFLVRQLKRG